jgi:hypothetical protein
MAKTGRDQRLTIARQSRHKRSAAPEGRPVYRLAGRLRGGGRAAWEIV